MANGQTAPAAQPQQGVGGPLMPMQNAFSILAQAPIDVTNLFTRQVNETINTLSLGTSQLAASLSLPALPFSAPMLPQLPAANALALPSLPGLGGFGGPTSAPVAAQLYQSTPQAMPIRRIGPRVVI
jgi:ABC-type iron transport system FetAB permease component